MFVVVSIYTNPENDKTIIHAYGPKDTRSSAETLRNKMRKDDAELHGESSSYLSLTVCKILGPNKEEL